MDYGLVKEKWDPSAYRDNNMVFYLPVFILDLIQITLVFKEQEVSFSLSRERKAYSALWHHLLLFSPPRLSIHFLFSFCPFSPVTRSFLFLFSLLYYFCIESRVFVKTFDLTILCQLLSQTAFYDSWYILFSSRQNRKFNISYAFLHKLFFPEKF